jgi:hypothetical protein
MEIPPPPSDVKIRTPFGQRGRAWVFCVNLLKKKEKWGDRGFPGEQQEVSSRSVLENL